MINVLLLLTTLSSRKVSRIEEIIEESNLAKHCEQPPSIVAAIGGKVVRLFEVMDLLSGLCMVQFTSLT